MDTNFLGSSLFTEQKLTQYSEQFMC